MQKNLTGLLLTFIGLIIGLFTGFGFILVLIGMFMMAGQDDAFRKSRNAFIGTLLTSVVGFFVLIGIGGVAAISAGTGARIAQENALATSAIGVSITAIIMFIALLIFNLRAYKYLLSGCKNLAIDAKEMQLVDKYDRTYNNYRNSLILTTIFGILTFALAWIPVLNVILIIILIGLGIWYFIAQIMVIIRVWQTYALKETL